MKDMQTQVDGGSTDLPAADFNEITTELENIILSSGQTLTSADLAQISQAIQDIAVDGEFYDAAGTNNIILTNPNHPVLKRAVRGQKLRFIQDLTNTGAVTLGIDGLSTVDLVGVSGIALPPGALVAGSEYIIIYDDINARFALSQINEDRIVVNATTINTSTAATVNLTRGIASITVEGSPANLEVRVTFTVPFPNNNYRIFLLHTSSLGDESRLASLVTKNPAFIVVRTITTEPFPSSAVIGAFDIDLRPPLT